MNHFTDNIKKHSKGIIIAGISIITLISLTVPAFSKFTSTIEKSIPITIIGKESVLLDGKTLNSNIKKLVNSEADYESSIEQINAIAFVESNAPEGAINLSESGVPVYAWLDEDTVKIYTKAEKIIANSDSSYALSGFPNITSFKLGRIDASQIADASHLFEGDSSLMTLTGLKMNSTALTDINSMYKGCSSLKEANFIDFCMDNITDISECFSGCTMLSDVDLSTIITDNVLSFAGMFNGCASLEELDTVNINTSSATDLSNMFNGCEKLLTLDLSGFNTESVTDMSQMFKGCTLLSVADLKSFETSNVLTMTSMFADCENIRLINISNWNPSSLCDVSNMFKNCASLESIYATEYTDMTSVELSDSMFLGCTHLIGGYGTSYDPLTVDATYAKIDEEESPGLFSDADSIATLLLITIDSDELIKDYTEDDRFDASGIGAVSIMMSGISKVLDANSDITWNDGELLSVDQDVVFGKYRGSECYIPLEGTDSALKPYKISINPCEIVSPQPEETDVNALYTGEYISNGYNKPSNVTVKGQEGGTEVGTYIAKYKPSAGYKWPDGTKDEITVKLTISNPEQDN